VEHIYESQLLASPSKKLVRPSSQPRSQASQLQREAYTRGSWFKPVPGKKHKTLSEKGLEAKKD
jgi:hypothetical protein